MRIALAQINTIVGDIAGNLAMARDAVAAARRQQASIVLLPELGILGYPPRDVVLKKHVVERCEAAVAELAREVPDDLLVVIGSPRRHGRATGCGISNSAALCRGGEIIAWYDKRLLPTYDVFDEHRYFDPGSEPLTVVHDGSVIGITVCEDLWNDPVLLDRRLYDTNIVEELAAADLDLVLNISASPFVVGKPEFRLDLFGRVAHATGAPLAFVNLVGGNDDLIFDGFSGIIDSRGLPVHRAPGFESCIEVFESTTVAQDVAPPLDDMETMFDALRLGVRDYVRKCGFSDVIVGLSGGIDSAVVVAIARAALGPENVRGFGMPSRYSSEGSVNDARDLAHRLGVRFDLVPIEPAHQAMLDMLDPLFAETGKPPGVAEENIQARLRGNILMSLSNKTGALLLTTGNKSELAVGYCTLYGDMAGGLAVISDVPKTQVYKLARWMNANPDRLGPGMSEPPIPESTLTKPPSAELRPDQTDQDSLPPYNILDQIIERHVEALQGPDQIVRETGIDASTVEKFCRMIDRNEYKRRQMPTGLKVTGRAFGSGWRMPIAAKS